MGKPRVLVVHHVEPMWNSCFDEESFVVAVSLHISRSRYDKIIVTTLEGDRRALENYPYYLLLSQADVVVEWSYAWDREFISDLVADGCKREDFIQVTSAHETAYLYDWIKELEYWDVVVCGGHRLECLQDLCESLDHLGIRYKKKENLVYG